jgi:hypothetical protein
MISYVVALGLEVLGAIIAKDIRVVIKWIGGILSPQVMLAKGHFEVVLDVLRVSKLVLSEDPSWKATLVPSHRDLFHHSSFGSVHCCLYPRGN